MPLKKIPISIKKSDLKKKGLHIYIIYIYDGMLEKFMDNIHIFFQGYPIAPYFVMEVEKKKWKKRKKKKNLEK